MKKLLLLFAMLLALASSVTAQDTALVKNRPTPNLPLIVIKGSEIRRFPGTNFMDAVTGLFPWVSSLTPDANDFLFVVNGFLLPDINSLCLYDIEEVTFVRNDLNGSLYPFSRAGTFYVTTRKYNGTKASISFNSQYNAVWSAKQNKVEIGGSNNGLLQTFDNEAGHLLSSQSSLLAGGRKWSLYLSAQLDQSTGPATGSTTINISPNSIDTSAQNVKPKFLNVRSFMQFNYKVSSTLQVGITGSYFHGDLQKNMSQLEYRPNGRYDASYQSKSLLPYYHVGAFANWRPLENLSNRLSFEYANDELTHNAEKNSIQVFNGNTRINALETSKSLLNQKRLLVRDELTYNFVNRSKFQAGVSTIFSFLGQKPGSEYYQAYASSTGSMSSSGSTFNYTQKLTSLNPSIHISYNKIVSAYGGYAFLLNKDLSRASPSDRSNPYAGLVVDIKQMTKADKLTRLDVSLTYGNMSRNNANSYWLPAIDNVTQFLPFPIISFAVATPINSFPNASLANVILKNRLIGLEANAGFNNNKLLVGAAYSQLRSEFVYVYSYSAGGMYSAIALQGTEKQKGVSAYIAAKLIDKRSKTWLLRLNVLMPDVSYQFAGNMAPAVPHTDELQAGLQNYINYKNWYGQVNGLMQLNSHTINTFVLNYLMIGYNFSGSHSKAIQKVSVFAHARNLLASSSSKRYYQYYSYGGAGINLNF